MSTQAKAVAQELVAILKKEDLYELLPEITKELEAEVDRSHDISVISAVELTGPERKEVEEFVTKKWGDHRVVLSVDPVLLSGMLITFRDIVLDLSGKNALTSLKQELQ